MPKLIDAVSITDGTTEVTVIDTSGHLYQGGTEITSSAAEINALDITGAGTVQASKVVVASADKDIGDFRNLDCTNLDAGASGTAGTVDVFPTTATKGKLIISCAAQTGNTNYTIRAAAAGQAATVLFGDPGKATAVYVAMSNTVMTPTKVNALIQGIAAGYKVARGTVACTASSAINTGLASITGYAVSVVGTTATAVNNACQVSAKNTGAATLTAYRWKHGGASTTTLAAASTAGTVSWIACGT